MTARVERNRGRDRSGAVRHLIALAVLALFPLDTSARVCFDPYGATVPRAPVAVFFRLTHLLQPMPGHPPAGTSFLCLPPLFGENS